MLSRTDWIEKNAEHYCFQPWAPQANSREVVERAKVVLGIAAADGYRMTVRQVFYQFVARNWLSNSEKAYKRLSVELSKARLAGLIDMDAIEDRSRAVIAAATWRDPGHRISSAANNYKIDKWHDQPERVEVWSEKEALIGLISDTCAEWDVPCFACKGCTSTSAMWEAKRRWDGEHVHIIYVGDHDPAGLDMPRSLQSGLDVIECDASVKRVALSMDQVRKYRLPPNPVKDNPKDRLAQIYKRDFGEESWELDALPWNVVRDVIEKKITAMLDEDAWVESIAKEASGRDELMKIATRLIRRTGR